MRLEQLKYLQVTANCHSMHKVSEILHVSQQNISKAIRDLEKELDVVLFDRTTSGMYLTSAGEKVYLLASEACACTDRISNLFAQNVEMDRHQRLKGSFTAVTIPGYSLLIYNAFEQFHESCPRVQFHLEEREALDVVYYLRANGCEWALTTLDKTCSVIADEAFWQTYEILILRQDYFKVLTTVFSPLVQYQSVSDKQLTQYPLVAYATSADRPPLVQQILEREGIKPKWFLQSNSQAVFSESIAQKSAIAISNDFIIQSATRKNENGMVLLPMTRKIPIYHLIIKKKNLSEAGMVFHQYLLKIFAQIGLTPRLYDKCGAEEES